MDDLSERCVGFRMFRSCTKQQFWNVAKMVAHFQAVAACNGKDLTNFKDIFHTANYHKEIFYPMIGTLIDYHPSKWLLEIFKTIAYRLEFKEPIERLLKIYSPQFSKYVLIDKPAEFGKHRGSVIV
jgi:hypothetical protein